MAKNVVSEKILCLGVDGLDPRLTRKYVDKGKMPHVKQLIERGGCREDLVLLGGHPTVTPPMWTTLATGCYANVHGITGFYRLPDDLKKYDMDEEAYNLNSLNCKAEQVWNVFAEAGKKTLVWHWPGSSWPPSSDSPNLMVVDGTVPGSVNVSAQVEKEFFFIARTDIEAPNFLPAAAQNIQAACVIENVHAERDVKPVGFEDKGLGAMASVPPVKSLIIDTYKQGQWGSLFGKQDVAVSSIKTAKGWAAAPENALECAILFSKGAVRRPVLILADENGKYNRIAIYKSKKATEPIAVIKAGEFKRQVLDVTMIDDKEIEVNRNMALLELSEDGSNIRMWISNAMDIHNNVFWHPQTLLAEIAEATGMYPPPTCMIGSQEKDLIQDVMLQNWYSIADYQSAALKYMIEKKGVEVIFSHFHSVDLQSHRFIRYMYDKGENVVPVEQVWQYMEDVYKQVDYYVAQFMEYLDKDWTIFLFSDHAQICGKHRPYGMGDIVGINIPVMKELGFTVLQKDENGKEIAEIDWTKTKAIAWGEQHIYLNLIGRTDHGIVDPKDQYDLEEEIITALYGYKHPETGKRIISVALRNRDAVLLGQGGPYAGDICYWVAEGYNYDHADTLSTALGEAGTSVSPIFIAAGKGIKQGYTDRIIRQIDFAPTVAAVGGMRMPHQCEGAPVYQILEKEM